ncbi:hypothetical protein KSF78_0001341 [Schistosoma japonicum]|nr:hypothetical protein KSF78_0001341 [Schistosoma japonicum]
MKRTIHFNLINKHASFPQSYKRGLLRSKIITLPIIIPRFITLLIYKKNQNLSSLQLRLPNSLMLTDGHFTS